MRLTSVTISFTVLLFFRVTSAQTVPPQFKAPVNLGPQINTSAVESDPFWDGPRKRLYFIRDFDIWYSQWEDTTWADPIKLGPQINGAATGEQSPSISPDGQRLFFVVDARDGYLWDIWVSTWNSSINDWGASVNLGAPVNTDGVEFSAKIGPEGISLYFHSYSDPDSLFPFGRCGFYVSEWNGTNWSVPMEVIPNLISCSIVSYPSITVDGSWLYFDKSVSDGKSSFVSHWNGSSWEVAADLRSQIGGRSGTPFVTPSGDSLFLSSGDIGGLGERDIWVMERIVLIRIPALNLGLLLVLVFLVTLFGIYWIRKRKIINP
jgi:hypothetical protein